VAVEAHLALCPGCAAYIEQMHETLRVVGRVPVESLSDAARDELMNAFRTFHTPAT
jgi:predicted anti-sigma-YlaC factor YlaD